MTKIYSKSDLMKLTIEEHLKCTEYPRVGAIIAKDGVVIATGYRGEIKNTHAERVAIEKLKSEQLHGSTIFTTLEPCIELHEEQEVKSCAELIIESGIKEVVIGVLDPNGTIYSQGYRKLLENNISVGFFSRKLRAAVEEETFDFGELHKAYGNGKRRISVLNSGTEIDIQFSQSDTRVISINWNTLQLNYGSVDLVGSSGSVRVAAGARHFSDITDPLVFRFPNHVARLKKGMIAVVKPSDATFCVLIKLVELFENDIIFQWEVRNEN